MFPRTLSSGRPLEIVGVVTDHKLQTLGEPLLPAIYHASTRQPASYNVVVARTRADENALLVAMRENLLALEPKLLFIDNQTMRAQMSATLLPVRAAATLVSAFKGVDCCSPRSASTASSRSLWLGAHERSVSVWPSAHARLTSWAWLMRQGLGLPIIGPAVGFMLAAAATRVVAGALYGIGVADAIA